MKLSIRVLEIVLGHPFVMFTNFFNPSHLGSAFIDMSVNTMDVCTAFSWKQQTTKCKGAEDYELLTFIFLHLFQKRTFNRRFYRPDAPSNQQFESTEGNPMHGPQPVTWRHPFFVQHWTLEGRGVGSATLVPYCYVSQKRMFFRFSLHMSSLLAAPHPPGCYKMDGPLLSCMTCCKTETLDGMPHVAACIGL